MLKNEDCMLRELELESEEDDKEEQEEDDLFKIILFFQSLFKNNIFVSS